MSAAFAASMQLIPSCTSTSTPSMVIFAIRVLGAPKRNAESAPWTYVLVNWHGGESVKVFTSAENTRRVLARQSLRRLGRSDGTLASRRLARRAYSPPNRRLTAPLHYQRNLRVCRFGGETPPSQPAGAPAFRPRSVVDSNQFIRRNPRPLQQEQT